MPVTIDSTEFEDLTRITLAGKVTLPEFVKALTSYAQNGPTRLEIYDVSRLDEDRFSTAEIDTLVDYLRAAPDRRPPNSKTAIIAAKTVDIGITRMISILSEGSISFKLEAFRSIEEAMDWLVET
jgi:hypothetical protein